MNEGGGATLLFLNQKVNFLPPLRRKSIAFEDQTLMKGNLGG